MPNFTSDWFSHNIPAWNRFFSALKWDSSAPKTIIEIGSYEGRACLWMLENLLGNDESRIFCVDVFAGDYVERFNANVRTSHSASKVNVRTSTSFSFLIQFLASNERADFIYIDGSHRAADVLEDLILSFRALKPGGMIICDDYLGGTKDGSDLTLSSPKIAVDAFTTIFRDRIEIVVEQPLYQLAFVKIGDRSDDDPTSRGLSARGE